MSELSKRDEWIARNCYTAGWLDRTAENVESEVLSDEDVQNLTEFAPPALQWTSTPPSEPGWYWYDDGKPYMKPCMVVVWQRHSGELTAHWPGVDTWLLENKGALGIRWAGPIPLPETGG